MDPTSTGPSTEIVERSHRLRAKITARQEHPPAFFAGLATVTRIEQPTPRLARITFAVDGTAFPEPDPAGEIITLIWPARGRSDVVLPFAHVSFPPDAPPNQHLRNYTVRAYDRENSTVTVDFVLHGDHGPGSRWARTATADDTIGFSRTLVDFSVSMPDTEWSFFAGDETALPYIAAALERLPAGRQVLAFIEVANADERQELKSAAEVSAVWVSRDDAPAGTTRALIDAVRAAELPPGKPKTWAAGEALAVRALREYLRGERGYEIGRLQAVGYWKHRDTPIEIMFEIVEEDEAS